MSEWIKWTFMIPTFHFDELNSNDIQISYKYKSLIRKYKEIELSNRKQSINHCIVAVCGLILFYFIPFQNMVFEFIVFSLVTILNLFLVWYMIHSIIVYRLLQKVLKIYL